MKEFKIELKGRTTTVFEGTINQGDLYLDDDGYTVHTGRVNRRDWHIMMVQLLARGYTSSEVYDEIRRTGIAPKGTNTMYNFLNNIKEETGIKFRIEEMTQPNVDKLRLSIKKAGEMPHNVGKKAGEKMMKFEEYSDMLSRREKSGRPFKEEEARRKEARNPYGLNRDDLDILKKLKRR